jgi:hypothetical protein
MPMPGQTRRSAPTVYTIAIRSNGRGHPLPLMDQILATLPPLRLGMR